MVDFNWKFSFWLFKRCSSQVWVYKGCFGQIWVKITERSIRFENLFSFLFHKLWCSFCSFWLADLVIRGLQYSTIFLIRSVMIFLNTGVCISRPIKEKAWNSNKSQLFAENFAYRFKWFFQWINLEYLMKLKLPSCVSR